VANTLANHLSGRKNQSQTARRRIGGGGGGARAELKKSAAAARTKWRRGAARPALSATIVRRKEEY